MNLKIVGAIAGLSVASVGALAGVAVAQNSGKFAATKAATVQTTRRIWVVNEEEWWKSDVVVKATGAGDAQYVNVYWVHNSYYKGLGYADIDSNSSSVAFKASGTEFEMTVDIALPDQIDSLSDSPDVFWLKYGTTNGHRNYSVGDKGAGLGSEEMANLLSHFATCNSSYAYGYNAYPQLMVNFWNASGDGAKSGYVTQGANEPSATTLKTEKIARMRYEYNKDHGTNLL